MGTSSRGTAPISAKKLETRTLQSSSYIDSPRGQSCPLNGQSKAGHPWPQWTSHASQGGVSQSYLRTPSSLSKRSMSRDDTKDGLSTIDITTASNDLELLSQLPCFWSAEADDMVSPTLMLCRIEDLPNVQHIETNELLQGRTKKSKKDTDSTWASGPAISALPWPRGKSRCPLFWPL